MDATIVECPFGVLAFSEENRVVDKIFFPKTPQMAAENYVKIEAGRAVNEALDLVNALMKSGFSSFVFENRNLAREVEKKLGVKVQVSKPSRAGDELRSELKRFAVETGFARNAEEFSHWLRSVTVEITKLKVKKAVEKRDLIVVQAIGTLDDVDKTLNLLMSRVREWYGIHFPELDRLLEKHESYVRLVSRLGSKDNFTTEKLEVEAVQRSKAAKIAKSAASSMGADLTENDLAHIQALCNDVLELYKLRQTLEAYVDTSMDEVAPNVKSIAGSLLGARLIALSGGLLNLAKMPASTVQVLGAEKALFRSLKTGTQPPKHGIIFQHAFLHEAKKWQRGKIARALAGKLAIAARTDAFGSRYIGEELKEDLQKRVEEILQKYSQIPETVKRKPKPRKKRKRRRASKR